MSDYCILTTIAPGDTKQGVRAHLDGLEQYLEGRQLSPGPDGSFEYFVLKGVTLGLDKLGQPIEVRASIVLGLDATPNAVSGNVQIEINKNYAAWRLITFVPPPLVTRAYMETRLRQFAGEFGCGHAWQVRPGPALPVLTPDLLLAQFAPLVVG
jgi:hypothetical protein